MWYFKAARLGLSSDAPFGEASLAWTVHGTFAVIFADGSALVTKEVRAGTTLAMPAGCSVYFEVSLGDLIVPEYPIGMEKMWLDGLVKADTEVVWYQGAGRWRQT